MSEDEFEVVYSYTRKQAIEDGVLVDVTEQAQETGFKVPVAITANLYHRYIEPPDGLEGEGQSTTGRLHDVLLLTFLAAKDRWDGSMVEIEPLFVMGEGPRFEKVKCWAVIGPGDSGEPVLTIMLPEDY
ncbi:DUF6573 family protein [Maridesulfovibrio sp.]|uniref:DUF6573 family protein n=1 Tax=Maridesulfovibrio sp. TaxID=2795000 RepID=UPI002A18CFE7|nr:DUF6573 family protein [Maridesulfovibrio sp.]